MPKATFIDHTGAAHTVDVPSGESLMRAAVDNNIKGIDGDCGGQCACATCHVFVSSPWAEKLSPQSSTESSMLEFTAERRESSRLACQITMSDSLDGIVVTMPAGQH